MVNVILRFVACSRTAGLRISTSEVLDCLDQLKLVDVLDENQFAAVADICCRTKRQQRQSGDT